MGTLAALSRLVMLGYPTHSGTPLFDEKHYVPQAWQILQSGHGLPFPFSSGIEDNPGYGLIVHPPVAKQVMAIGQWLFADSAVGWRFMSAVFGIAVVLMITDLTRRITGSHLAMLVAGGYAVVDGVLLVTSRSGMLDMIQTGFIIAGVWLLMVDRDQTARRLHQWRDMPDDDTRLGPYLGWRWWRLAAGVMFGLALGVKWSGLYYIAAFGLFSVFSDLVDRKRAGVQLPTWAALAKDTLPALRDLVLAPLMVYVLSWRSWFAEETSVYRHLPADKRDLPFELPTWLPDSLANYLHYQSGVLEFHGSLTTSTGHNHPWESKPWEWLVSWRPILYYSAENTCMGERKCDAWLMLFGTPPIWWLLVPVMLWAMWRYLARRDGRFAVPVIGFIASWLPWVIAFDRQMYFFYATALIPFVLIAYGIIAADLVKWTPRGKPIGQILVAIHIGLVICGFLFWMPLLYAIPLPEPLFNLMFWLPSWS